MSKPKDLKEVYRLRAEMLAEQNRLLKRDALVKQTWQAVYDSEEPGREVGHVRPDRLTALQDGEWLGKKIGILRRDTYRQADGTIYTLGTMEPLE